jgi:hypothetical protein
MRRYHHKRATRFFTLYFIPLVPLKDLGEYVECQTCTTAFDPAVKHVRVAPAVTAHSSDQLAAMMNALKPRLEEGYPVEFMVRDLTAARLDRSVALQAVENAIGTQRKTCSACGLTYAPTVTGCRECGRQLS